MNGGKNYIVAISKLKIVKRKYVSDGENLLEAPKDKILDVFPSQL